jgi:cytoskeleton protein RodZ
MSETVAASDPAAPSAGRLLREARERQGLHIAALAASIKVAPKKLELLEADRFDALPDATFTRALAQTVCRALKIDSAAILKLLPPPLGHRLDHVGEGLNAPFRERPGALVQRDGSSLTLSPVFWITALILIAAVGLYFVPSGLIGLPHWRGIGAASAAETGAASASRSAAVGAGDESASSAGSRDTPVNQLVAASPAAEPPVLAPPGMAAPGPVPATRDGAGATPGVIQLRTTAPSWVEVTDANGRALLARLVQPGEVLDLEGAAPFRVRIGNASGTRMSFRGQPMELAAYTRDNVARLELK